MRFLKTAILRIAAASAMLFGAYAALLNLPYPFFSYSVRAGSLILHSDQPISAAPAKHVLEMADAKLKTSPLYLPQSDHDIFICNARWRQMLFFNKHYGAGGVAPYPLTGHVFLRDASIPDNRLISPGGSPVAGDRTLDSFIAHEVAHQLTGRAIGPLRFYLLPQWAREGYADYVGKGASFDYNQSRRAFLAGAAEMDFKRSGLYSRFHLLAACLLDHQHWTVLRLLQHPPSQAAAEAAVRNEKP
jgi:hypothetical protein